MKKCINCGTDIEDAALFCPECGAKQIPESVFCPNCGTQLPSGASFCSECGSPTNKNNSSASPIAASGAFSIENLIKTRQKEYASAQKKVIEAQLKKIAEEEARKAEEKVRKEEEERLKREEEERKKAEAKAKREEAKRKKEEEERLKKEEQKRKIAEKEARKAEEKARKEEEERLKREEEERKKAEAKAKREEAKRAKLEKEMAEQERIAQILTQEDDGLPYVDLGLSVKWAKCNLGASCMEKKGSRYAWGETEEKSNYNCDNYKFGKESPLSKYQPKVDVLAKKHWFKADEYQTVGDNKTVLDACDDAAHVKLGENWKMPTVDDFKELVSECTWTCQTINKVKGCMVMSKKKGFTDKWIFFPFAGQGLVLSIWTSSLAQNHEKACCMNLYHQGKMVIHEFSDSFRALGKHVRPVMK